MQDIFATSNLLQNPLTIFHSDEFGEVRTLEINGQPWFIGKDMAEILGYADTNQAIRIHVDEEDTLIHPILTAGKLRNMTIINESGIYSLILRSSLPKAKAFKRWITSVIIPSIRKNGMFATEDLLNNPEMLVQVASRLQEERNARLKAEQQRNLLIHQDKLFTTTEIAKEINFTSALKLNLLLEQMQIQYKCNDCWVPTAKYAPLGYSSLKQSLLENGEVVYNRMWTAKGREFLLNLLKETGIYSGN